MLGEKTWEAGGGGRRRDDWEQHSGGLGFLRGDARKAFSKETCTQLSNFEFSYPKNIKLCSAPLRWPWA